VLDSEFVFGTVNQSFRLSFFVFGFVIIGKIIIKIVRSGNSQRWINLIRFYGIMRIYIRNSEISNISKLDIDLINF
jgi:hypothetical protein